MNKNLRFTNLQSCILAVTLHATVLVVFNFFDKSPSEQWDAGFNKNNTVSIELGSFGIKGGSNHPGKSGSPSISHNTAPMNSAAENNTLSGSAATATAAASGSGTGTGEGIGNGTGFEGAVQNYHEPAYPRAAIKRNLQGKLRVKIFINGTGTLKNIEVLSSSGHQILDKAALDAIASWTFKPHPENIEYYVNKTIIFELK